MRPTPDSNGSKSKRIVRTEFVAIKYMYQLTEKNLWPEAGYPDCFRLFLVKIVSTPVQSKGLLLPKNGAISTPE